jgi:O-antigen/teichoic acid export membrane protein
VVAFFGSIVAARYLKPEDLGIIQTLMLIPTYLVFLQLGVFNGLNRNIAYYLGRGDDKKVENMVNSSWAFAKYVGLTGAAISVALTFYFIWWTYPPLYVWGMAFVSLTLIAEPFSQHMEIVYLSTRNFRVLGVALLCQNVIVFLGNLLPALLGALGLVAARIVYLVSRFFMRWAWYPFTSSGPGSFKEMRELSVTGMPLLIAGTLYAYLGVADRSVVAYYLGPKEVGYFALAGLVVFGIQFVPQCLATLFYPRIAAYYGRTNSTRQLRHYFWILLGVNGVVVLPLCILTFLLIGPLTRRYLPNYVPGIEAAQIACLSSFGFIYIGVAAIIAVVRRNTLYIIAIAISLALVWLLGGYLVQQGYGIKGAIWARAIATSLLCLFTIGFTYWLTAKDIYP